MNSLPNEVLENIIQNLNSKDLINLSQISKLFRNLITDEMIKLKLYKEFLIRNETLNEILILGIDYQNLLRRMVNMISGLQDGDIIDDIYYIKFINNRLENEFDVLVKYDGITDEYTISYEELFDILFEFYKYDIVIGVNVKNNKIRTIISYDNIRTTLNKLFLADEDNWREKL